MSAWSSAAGKPQLSYAERLRNAAKPSATPSSTSTSKTELIPAKIVNASISQQRPAQPSYRSECDNAQGASSSSSSDKIKGESTAGHAANSGIASSHVADAAGGATKQQSEDAGGEPRGSTASEQPAIKAPVINVWEARKKVLAEKEAEKERLRQQQLAAQRKTNAAASTSGAPSLSKPGKGAGSSTSAASADASASKTSKAQKAQAAASASAPGQKAKQDKSAKSASAAAPPSADRKQAVSSNAKTQSPAKAPATQRSPHPIAQPVSMRSAPADAVDARAQGQISVKTADADPSSAAPTSNADAQSVSAEARTQHSAETGVASETAQSSAPRPAGAIHVMEKKVDASVSSTALGRAAEYENSGTIAEPVPSAPRVPSADTSLATAGGASDVVTSVTVPSQAEGAPQGSVEDAIEQALQANVASAPSAEEDDAWLARIHLLNGGQNMPKFGDFGRGGTGYGNSGGPPDESLSEADRLAARKAERAVATAWSAGKNVWQKGHQSKPAIQSNAPVTFAQPSSQAQAGPSRAAAFGSVDAIGGPSSAIRLSHPTALNAAESGDPGSASGKKKRRTSNASRGRGLSVTGTRPEVTRSDAHGSSLGTPQGFWTSLADGTRRDTGRAKVDMSREGDGSFFANSIDANRRTDGTTAPGKGSLGSVPGFGEATAAAGTSKKSKQASGSTQPQGMHTQAASAKKGAGAKASQVKSDGGKAGSSQAQPGSQKKQQQQQPSSSSKAAKSQHSAITENADGASSRDAPCKLSARTTGSAPDQSRDQSSKTSFDAATSGRGATGGSSSKVSSRRINGIVSESSGLSSGQNSVAGSPRTRPAHLPATPPPPTSFPPRNDASGAQPMSISASAQLYAHGSSSPLETARSSHAGIEGSQSPNMSTDATRNAAPGHGSDASNAAVADSWRGGSTPKRGRGANPRGTGRGGRGGGRGGAPESFSPHVATPTRERRQGNMPATGTESPLLNRQQLRTSAPYGYYSAGYVPSYPAEGMHDPALGYDASTDSPAYGGLPLYHVPPGQGYFGQVQAPMPTQWARYYVNTPQQPDVFSLGTMVEATSQTGSHVPSGTTQQLLSQIEFYFSQRNLLGDFFLRQRMDSQGWVDIATVASFKRVSQVTRDINTVKDTLLYSAVLDVDAEKMKVRKRFGWEAFVLPEDWKAAEVAGHGHGAPASATSDTAFRGEQRTEQDRHHLSTHSPQLGYQAHVDAANSATPSKVSTAMSSPPSSFTRASQDGADDDGINIALSRTTSSIGAAGSEELDGAKSLAKEEEYMNLGVVAASGLGGTLSSLSKDVQATSSDSSHSTDKQSAA